VVIYSRQRGKSIVLRAKHGLHFDVKTVILNVRLRYGSYELNFSNNINLRNRLRRIFGFGKAGRRENAGLTQGRIGKDRR